MRCFFLLILSLVFMVPLSATDYYVSAGGDDSNDGLSTATPFRTIQTAADLTLPGDVVYVMNGTYSNTYTWEDLVKISRSGTASAPIKYTNYPGHSPKIEFDGWHAFKIEGDGVNGGVSYIEISGFTIEGNNANINLTDAINQAGGCEDPTGNPDGFYNGNGIASDGRVNGKNHHLTIRNCTIYDCPGAGISAIHSDYITVENCEVYNNSLYSIYGNSGITFYQLYNFDNSSVVRNIIRNCRVYNNAMLVPWEALCAITDGNGIIIDDGRNTQNGSTNGVYTGQTLIENNVVYENGGRGIHVFESDHVDILNNTVYANGQSAEINDGEITMIFASDVKVHSNIIYSKDSAHPLNKINNATNINYDYNVHFNSNLRDDAGTNNLQDNPGFTDLNARDFTLTSNSPAIDAGNPTLGFYAAEDITGLARPVGAAPDAGAYESQFVVPVEYLQTLRAEAHKQGVLLTWISETELNASHYTLEKSRQGEDFSELVKIQAEGAGLYRFIDTDVLPGLNYYRLKQFDRDGTFSLSAIVPFTEKETIKIFPNPTFDLINIDQTADYTYLIIRGTQGQEIFRANKERNTYSLQGLSPGVYLAELYDQRGQLIYREKFVKQ